jgi:heat shock protein HtpX
MTRFTNNLKTVALMGGLMALVVVVGAQWGRQGLIAGLALGGLMNVAAWFFSDTIAIRSMQGREVDEQSAPDLYRMVDDLRRRAGLPMPRVYICPHDAPNAFATGRSPGKAAVAVTQGLLGMLSREELEGVIAHELAHIKNRDTLTSCIAATVAGVLAFLAQWGMLLGGGQNREGSNPLVSFLVIILAAVGASLIKAMISRSREFVADADGAAIAGSPRGLIGALAKLEAAAERIPLYSPNPAQNNLFIVEPFCGKTMTRMFASHPPTEDRIAALRGLA